ncbi:MAG: hypothetical protein EAZ80_02190, partial [Runella slithyformis]
MLSLCGATSYAQVSITTQPTPRAVCVGATATFSVVATGTISGYKWYDDNVLIVGANAATYITPITTAADNNSQYTVEVLSSNGNHLISNPATLTVNLPADIASGSSAPIATCEGDGITLSLTTNAGNITGYQWRKDGVDIAG